MSVRNPLPVAARSEPAFEITTGDLGSGLIVLCDHASNAIPAEFGNLGLAAADLERHIAYDIGAATLSRSLAAALGAPAVLSRFSRLLIDPNRGDDDPTLVMRLSDGAIVPGNARIDAAGIAARQERFSRPYHTAVAGLIDEALVHGIVPVIVSIHSFTPVWRGTARPWHVAVLWDADPRLNVPLIQALRADPNLVVGDNEPYDGVLEGDTINRHVTNRGLAGTLIELRQDLIADPKAAEAWGQRLADVLRPLLSDPSLSHMISAPSRARPRLKRQGEAGGAAAVKPIEDIEPIEDMEPVMSDVVDPIPERDALQAAAFRRLLSHLSQHPEVQNIDLMNLAGFCRNCLANWLLDAATEQGVPLDKEASRTHVYGMPYAQWKALHQTEASAAQQQAFANAPKARGDAG